MLGREVKLSLFSDDIILYIEDPKYSTKNLVDLITIFSDVAGVKVSTRKTVAFFVNKE